MSAGARTIGDDSRLDVAPDEVHLWCLGPGLDIEDALLARYAALLSEDERQRLARYVTSDAAKQFVCTRALVRVVLSRYAARRPVEWVFARGPHGKSIVAVADPNSATNLAFSVSHTESMIVMAVSTGIRVGVDTESAGRKISLELMRRTLADPEYLELVRLPDDVRAERFLELWTLKESWLKAVGIGLDFAPSHLLFSILPDRRVDAAIVSPPAAALGDWQFVQCAVDGHIVAVCSEQSEPIRLRCRRIIPLARDEQFDAEVLRFSQRAVRVRSET